MRDVVILFVHLIVTVIRLARPGGFRSVVAESMLVKHQLLILNRGRKRAPNLRAADRVIAGLCTLFMRPSRVLRSAIVLKPSTLLHFHNMLKKRKYGMFFSHKRVLRPGPKGPNKELIVAVVAKRRNPNWGCPRIAQQIRARPQGDRLLFAIGRIDTRRRSRWLSRNWCVPQPSQRWGPEHKMK